MRAALGTDEAAPYIEAGTPAFRRTNLALFAAGFSTFALLYCVQPLMPEFSREFGVGAAASSLSLSLTTGLLAVAMLVASSLSEALGRKPVMVVSLLASAGLTLVAALAPGWHALLLVRALEGITFSGLPAVAMAYVGEEMHPRSIGLAMGLYISGSGLGGMLAALPHRRRHRVLLLARGARHHRGVRASGRAGGLAQPAALGPLPAAAAVAGHLLARFAEHLRDKGLPWLFAEGFLLMGSFVTVYNYIGYRLLAPPYGLGQTAVGAIFLVYLVGIAARPGSATSPAGSGGARCCGR